MLTYTLTFLASATPISLLIIFGISKLLSKHHHKLGQTSVICTTLKGVLTKNVNVPKTIIFDKFEADINQESDLIYLENQKTKEEVRVQKKQLSKNEHIKLMAITTTLCHYAKIHKVETIIGKFFKSCAISTSQIRHDYDIITEISSDKEKKFSTVVVKNIEKKEILSFSKGNPYKILERCKRLLIHDKKIEITPQLRRKLKKRIKKLNQNGQKIISFAYKGLPVKQLEHYSESFVENDLVLIGMIGIGDIIDEKTIPIVEKIKGIGIKTYVLSAAKKREAIAIAETTKLIDSHYFETLTHEDLKDISQQKLEKLFLNQEKDYVFAEIKKEDRQKIIAALQKNGHTIVMAKQSNKLSSILKGIEKHQYNKQNRQKIITHALSCKIAQVLLISTAIIFKAPLPLSIIAIVAIDLLINLLLESSLRKEKNEDTQVSLYRHLIVSGLITGVILTGIYFWNLIRLGWYPGESLSTQKASTMIFILLCLSQILSAHSLRNNQTSIFLNAPLKNIYLALSSIITILILYALLNFELLSLPMLSKLDWPIVIFSLVIILTIEEIRKYLIRKDEVSKNKSHPEKL